MTTNLQPLRSLLKHVHSRETCPRILDETARLYREPLPERWYFLLLNRVFAFVIDDPDMFYGVSEDNPSPTLNDIAQTAISGIGAIERMDEQSLISSANHLTEKFSALL